MKNVSKKLLFFILQAVLLVPAKLIYADSSIDLELTRTEVDFLGLELKETREEKENLTVYLGKDYFFTDNGKEKIIYDFKNRKIIKMDIDKKSYQNFSLYSLVGFRVLEIENRLKVHDLLRGSEKNILLEPVILEHNFSLGSDRNGTKINKTEIGGFLNYSFEKNPLARIKISGQKLSGEDQKSFVRFLRYTLGGHNLILAGINESGRIPDEFIFYKYDGKNIRAGFKLKNIKSEKQAQYSLEGYKPAVILEGAENINSLISGLNIDDRGKITQKIASIQVDIQSALDKQNYLEALLGCLESGLYNGVFNIEICQNNIQAIQNDTHAKTLFTYLSPGDQITPDAAYKEFEALEKIAGEKIYILWIFEADMLSRMNKKKEALEKFHAALKENPYIAGIYKDIGEIYYNNFNTDIAWSCWDTARSIYPEHSMLKPITELEENFQKKYPEYFN